RAAQRSSVGELVSACGHCRRTRVQSAHRSSERRPSMAVSRRSLLKGISMTSLVSALPSWANAAPKRSPGPYQQLGIRPVVNFQGTMTTLGASKMWEDLHEAAAQAS